MARTSFEELRVYRLAENLADGIWTIVADWDYFARDTVGKQIVRAADSIGANIAEGTGQGSFQSNRRYVRTARGSLDETRHWLRRAHTRGLLNPASVARLRPIIEELGPKLNAYLRSTGATTGKLVLQQHDSLVASRTQRTKDEGPRTKDTGRAPELRPS